MWWHILITIFSALGWIIAAVCGMCGIELPALLPA